MNKKIARFIIFILFLLITSCSTNTALVGKWDKKTGCDSLPNRTLEPAATPRISAAPDIPALVSAFTPLLSGQGVPDAANYDPQDQGPHRVLVLSTIGAEYSVQQLTANPLPSGWQPNSVDQTELVVVMGPNKRISLESAPYTQNGNTIYIPRIHFEQYMELRVARTGQILDSNQFIGSDPIDFPPMSWVAELTGSNFTSADLENWICPWVNPSSCWGIDQEIVLDSPASGNIALSPDGRTLASITQDGDVIIWDASSWTRYKTISEEKASKVAFSPDGSTLASRLRNGTIALTDTASWSRVGILGDFSSMILCFAFSPDGEIIASGSADGTVVLWRLDSRENLGTFAEHESRLGSLAFSPDGCSLASASTDGRVLITQVSTRTTLAALENPHNGAINALAFSPDGRILAGGFENTRISLWDTANWTEWRSLSAWAGGGLKELIFSPDGETIVSSVALQLWDVASGTLLRNPAYPWPYYSGIAFSPDGLTLIGVQDTLIQVWKLNSEK